MVHAFTSPRGRTRLRPSVLALLAALVGTACDNTDPIANSAPSDPPAAAATADSVTTTGSLAPAFATTSTSGIPFGPFGLWNSYTSVKWGPAPFTSSQSYVDAGGIVTLINSARSKGQRLVLAMTGGSSTNYTTNGKFDMAKWKNRMNRFNTSAIKTAVAAGVADGTITANSIIDEPETVRWGGVLTKPLLDQMATYAKAIFPTLPQGVNHGGDGYKWRTNERFHVVDYVMNNYVSRVGDVAAWRNNVLAQDALDGVRTGFSLNILGGGVQDKDGNYNCTGTGQAGIGPYYPTCRMTADQVRTFGRTLGPSGCALLMWKYDAAFMSKSANQLAFKDVASTLASQSALTCRRS